MAPQEITPEHFPWLDTSRYSFSPGIEAAGAAWLAGQTAGAYDAESGRVTVSGEVVVGRDAHEVEPASAGLGGDDALEIVHRVLMIT